MIADAEFKVRIAATGNQGECIGRQEKKYDQRLREREVCGDQVRICSDKYQYGA